MYSIHNIRGIKDKPGESDAIIKPEEEDPNVMLKEGTAVDIPAENLDSTSKHKGSNNILRKKPKNVDLEKEVARTALSKNKDAELLPQIDDPNSYCRKKYSNKYGYNGHLAHRHGVEIPQNPNKTPPADPDKRLPDPHDLDFYCRVCKVTQFNLTEHRYHCRTVHHMVFELRYKNPDAVIDIDCPNFYCPKCEK
ncbi:hypothetical protein [Parasitella parasitica]|uniref:C2H2-type domain-containing protein n=1 Tax=Parasitella parasitica TaxID=35722 RepID=A0A0B7N9P4_9FUNG|nr:hypothetical protein [Parasitella parasitica]